MLNKGIRSDLATDTPIYTFSDEVTKRKIRRHLTDINDIITDKDIKDAKVPGAEEKKHPSTAAGKKTTATKSKSTRKQKKNVVDDTPGNPATPWDVLEE
jgi:hypothetical protein